MTPASTDRPLSSRAWILACGALLAAVGFAIEPQGGAPSAAQPLPSLPAYASADSNGSMIAVTGVDLTGSSVLYLIDTESRHLSVYQAMGGSDSTAGVRWLGARNIDLDLRVDGWNDRSKHSYKQLEAEFEELGLSR